MFDLRWIYNPLSRASRNNTHYLKYQLHLRSQKFGQSNQYLKLKNSKSGISINLRNGSKVLSPTECVPSSAKTTITSDFQSQSMTIHGHETQQILSLKSTKLHAIVQFSKLISFSGVAFASLAFGSSQHFIPHWFFRAIIKLDVVDENSSCDLLGKWNEVVIFFLLPNSTCSTTSCHGYIDGLCIAFAYE